MKLLKLPIGNADAVDGVFSYAATLAGDVLIYAVWPKAKEAPQQGRVLLPDQGDETPPDVEVLDPLLAGFTSTGRRVLLFRSGERAPNSTEWTGRSVLYVALSGPSNDRAANHNIVVNVTQPGDAGGSGEPGGTIGGEMTEEQLRTILRDELNETIQTVENLSDHMWPDIVGRMKGIAPDAANQTAAKLAGAIQDGIAAQARDDGDLAEAVWTGLGSAPDHFGLPEDAQQGLWWQDAMVYAMRDFLASQMGQQLLAQAVTSALVEGKIIPSTTKNPQPLVNP